VEEIYVRDPLTATPNLDIMQLRKGMLDRHARYVPVCDGNTLLGVVSFHDIAKAVYEEQSFENRMLKSYINDSPRDMP
jgi:CBS domain-containing protein